MKLDSMAVGLIGTNCYLLWDETAGNAAAIVDPGGSADQILAKIKQNNLDVKMILLTHGHFDHVMGVRTFWPPIPACRSTSPRPTILRPGTEASSATPWGGPSVHFYDEGDTVELGTLKIDVLRTPGHTPAPSPLRVEDALFTGDTLFRGSCGRTDFPGGSFGDMQRSLKRLADLPGDYRVYSRPRGLLHPDYERKYNPFMQRL